MPGKYVYKIGEPNPYATPKVTVKSRTFTDYDVLHPKPQAVIYFGGTSYAVGAVAPSSGVPPAVTPESQAKEAALDEPVEIYEYEGLKRVGLTRMTKRQVIAVSAAMKAGQARGEVVLSPAKAAYMGFVSQREKENLEQQGRYIVTTPGDVQKAHEIKQELASRYPGAQVSPGVTPQEKLRALEEQRARTEERVATHPSAVLSYPSYEGEMGVGALSEIGVGALLGDIPGHTWKVQKQFAGELLTHEKGDLSNVDIPITPFYPYQTKFSFNLPFSVTTAAKTGAFMGAMAATAGAGLIGKAAKVGVGAAYAFGLGTQYYATAKDPTGENVARSFVYTVPAMIGGAVKAYPKARSAALVAGTRLKGGVIWFERTIPPPPQQVSWRGKDIITMPSGKEKLVTGRIERPEVKILYEDKTKTVREVSQMYETRVIEPKVFETTKIRRILGIEPKMLTEGRTMETVGKRREVLSYDKLTGEGTVDRYNLRVTKITRQPNPQVSKTQSFDVAISKTSEVIKGPKTPEKTKDAFMPSGNKPIRKTFTAKDFDTTTGKPVGGRGRKLALELETEKVPEAKTMTESAMEKTGRRTGSVLGEQKTAQKTGFRSMVYAGTSSAILAKQKPGTKARSMLGMEYKTRQSQKQAFAISSAVAFGQPQRPAQAQRSALGFRQAQAQKNAFGLASLQAGAFGTSLIGGTKYKPPVAPTGFAGGDFGGGGSGRLTGERKYKYTPSLAGIVSGKTIGKAPTGSLSGLERRYPVKKRKSGGGLI